VTYISYKISQETHINIKGEDKNTPSYDQFPLASQLYIYILQVTIFIFIFQNKRFFFFFLFIIIIFFFTYQKKKKEIFIYK
jgi:hypothetical protein